MGAYSDSLVAFDLLAVNRAASYEHAATSKPPSTTPDHLQSEGTCLLSARRGRRSACRQHRACLRSARPRLCLKSPPYPFPKAWHARRNWNVRLQVGPLNNSRSPPVSRTTPQDNGL